MATEDQEWKKLSIEDRCVHKQWKARVSGYEDAAKLFKQIDDEKSPEFSRYLGLIKKFVTDSNAMGQEKGLEAALAYVENYASAGKTVNDVMSGIVAKCIAAPRTKTRELAVQTALMYVEIEKFEAVQDELIKGMDQKNPKIVAACITTVTEALREFGTKIITPKLLIKKIPVLFADRDKAVRDEARSMVVELFKWIGPALRSQLNNLQPVQVTDLEAEFAKVEGSKAVPTRYIRSQQAKQAKLAAETAEIEGDEDVEEEGCSAPAVDPYDSADPVDILSKLPKNFYDQLEAKKWQERKEALEILEKLMKTPKLENDAYDGDLEALAILQEKFMKTPKLENGDYGDLVRALRKIIQKDTNVVVIALAGKNLACLANGLKKRFQQYAAFCVPVLLEKFKEKKQNVVLSIREAIDAVFDSITIEVILEDVLEALNSKNPSVKAETAAFLSRAFAKTPAASINKKLLKSYSAALIKNINEPDPTVRDCASDALGTLMKVVGPNAIGPFLTDIEKDNLKMSKIKECCDKAVLIVKVAIPKKVATEKVIPSQSKTSEAVPGTSGNATKPKRPLTASGPSKKKVPAAISSGSATIVKSKSNKAIIQKASEAELSEGEAIEIVSDILKPETLTGLADTNWKNRLGAVENFLQEIQSIDASSAPTQALVKVLTKKPGLKDTNFQVLKARLDALKHIADNCPFSITCGQICINDVIEKLSDSKNGALAGEVLLSIAEATEFEFVTSLLIDFALTQKNPKVLEESLLWLTNAIKEFGFRNVNAKTLIEGTKKALASSNPSVRTAAISLVGSLYLYIGPSLHMFFENEKPTLREQINAEIEKYENVKCPSPVRGLKKEKSNVTDQENVDPVQMAEAVQNLLPKVDISAQITESLIEQMADKNWKVRNETLAKVNTIILEAAFIKPNICDLPQALALRLVDSNGKIAQTALSICENIATSMGAPCKQYVRVLLPGFLQCLGDSKTWIRTSAVNCLNLWGDLCSYKEFFECEMIADALKSGSPILRSELWMWLAEKLPKIKTVPREELLACIPHLYSNLEDRNADVRKNAQEAVLGLMIHLSFETMNKQTEKLKPGSKTVVVAALDKARPNLPVKPLTKPKQTSPEDKAVRGTKPVANSKNATKPKGVATVIKPSSARKKEEDVDNSPLMTVNNLKHQRTIDENKLKVLKWNFTTPREEFVELLKEQMLAANINRTLIANMFHIDFRFHIKAIESLMEDLPGNGPALISNLDLILKWLSIRFFDTNPAVIMKGLEYLQMVFDMLIEVQYHMLENEGSAFIPYLVLKVGDPKDAVRNIVKILFNQLATIFAVSRLFFYVMEGIKSKNARQRTECLDVMSSLIENYGLGVCLPSPAVCLKEIAKQISDRDNAVRNAALNCIVNAYFIVGEKVLKMVGQISDKDMSLLEERIKRAKKPLPKASRSTSTPESTPLANVASPVEEVEETMNHDVEDEIDDIPVIPTIETPVVQDERTGPFQLDLDIMRELDNWKPIYANVKLQVFDLDFLNEEMRIPTLEDARAMVMPISPPKPIFPSQTVSRSSLGGRPQFSPRATKDVLLEKTIDNMTSTDYNLAFKSIEQMQEIIQSNKGGSIIDYENQFMSALVSQLKILQQEDPRTNAEVLKIYRSVLTVIDTFYYNKLLGRKVGTDVLMNIMKQLITLLVEAKLEGCKDGDVYVRVVNLQCLKIIEKSDHTNSICALVKLLHDSIEAEAPPRLVDLVMKCLWRIIKIMPSWGDDIDYDSVLYEVHMFLKDFPSAWWKTKSMDTPLRTVKTILHTMVKMKGGQLMLHLGKILNTSDSELESYIVRLLRSMKLEEIKQVPLKTEKTEPKKTLSRHVHTHLTEVFQKIGNKEESKEGFNLLYDFCQQHPDTDLSQFLQKSSTVFQDYVKQGLKSVENSRNLSNNVLEKSASSLSAGDSAAVADEVPMVGGDKDGGCSEPWRDRLDMLKHLWDEAVRKTSYTSIQPTQ